jgi:hypothetical protein
MGIHGELSWYSLVYSTMTGRGEQKTEAVQTILRANGYERPMVGLGLRNSGKVT